MTTETIQVEISLELAEKLKPYQAQLSQILELGLHVWATSDKKEADIEQTLLETGFISHLSLPDEIDISSAREKPPQLSGPDVSDILLEQRGRPE